MPIFNVALVLSSNKYYIYLLLIKHKQKPIKLKYRLYENIVIQRVLQYNLHYYVMKRSVRYYNLVN